MLQNHLLTWLLPLYMCEYFQHVPAFAAFTREKKSINDGIFGVLSRYLEAEPARELEYLAPPNYNSYETAV